MYYYSATTNLFYPDLLIDRYKESNSLPEDIVKVSYSIWNKYAGCNTPDGMMRVAGDDGMPKWSPIPEKSQEDRVKEIEDRKSRLLTELSNITQIWQTQLSLKIINDNDKSKLKEWMQYAQKIQAIDASKAPDIVWPKPPEK